MTNIGVMWMCEKGLSLCTACGWLLSKEPKNNMLKWSLWLHDSLLFLLWKHLIRHEMERLISFCVSDSKSCHVCWSPLSLVFTRYSCQRVVVWVWRGEAGRLRCGGTADRHADQTGDVCRDTVLDGPGGHPAVCVWLEGTSLRMHSHLTRFCASKRFQNHWCFLCRKHRVLLWCKP